MVLPGVMDILKACRSVDRLISYGLAVRYIGDD